MPNADIGVVGLGVMGRNIALNLADHGYRVTVYNRTFTRTEELMASVGPGQQLFPVRTLAELADQLAFPRKILLMIQAGPAVDQTLAELSQLLSSGDAIIDGGNSQYVDTANRTGLLAKRGLFFIGVGISGGEEGARYGPSIMPGGNIGGWPLVQKLLTDIAAVAPDGSPCCDWLGPDGSGHFVKMVHNGIEYGDMQIIAEIYHLLREQGTTPSEMSELFSGWNQGRAESYLLQITAQILTTLDQDGSLLLDHILDAAGQKGTGRWTVTASMDHPTPLTLITESVYARMLSALVNQRQQAAELLPPGLSDHRTAPIPADRLEQSLFSAKILSYTQGFMLAQSASEHLGWQLNLARVASLWRAGCIIRARLLDHVITAYQENPALDILIFDSGMRALVGEAVGGLREVVTQATAQGVPVPALSSALAFYDSLRSARLPANLIQAQRDFFGAHTYERTDRPRGEFFHTNWSTN